MIDLSIILQVYQNIFFRNTTEPYIQVKVFLDSIVYPLSMKIKN